jgi:hypothetical protein
VGKCNGKKPLGNVDAADGKVLTYSCIKFIDVPLFMLYVATCIQTYCTEVF